MNSLESIKQELITQKTLLEERGCPVNVQHTYPSPSEITETIRNINMDFTIADAKEEDVRAGKTFYAQNSELKTGTLDASEIDYYKNMVYGLLVGDRPMEIFIPTDCTQIRPYAYYSYSDSPYYKDILIIPENITKIGNAAFYGAVVTNRIVVPSSCTSLKSEAFRKINTPEIIVGNGITSTSTWCIADSPTLKKVTVCDPISILPANCIAYNKALVEVYLPASMKEITAYGLSDNTNLKMVRFTGPTPPTISTATFSTCKKAALTVPYQYYDTYYNATNYQKYTNPFLGYGDFTLGDTLPTSIEGYSIVWYETWQKALSATEPVTLCPATGTMYAVLTAIT